MVREWFWKIKGNNFLLISFIVILLFEPMVSILYVAIPYLFYKVFLLNWNS